MREVSYAGGTFVTSDEIADALLDYAAALANADRATAISVPALGPDGPIEVRILVGPASQIVTATIDRGEVELDGTAFLGEVQEDVRRHDERFSPTDQESPLDWDV